MGCEDLSTDALSGRAGSELARVTVEFDSGERVELTLPDDTVRSLLLTRKAGAGDSIIGDLERVIGLENVRFVKKYPVNDCVSVHLRVFPSRIRLSLEVCGDFYTVYNTTRDDFSLDDFEETIRKLYSDTEKFVFDVITSENTDVRLLGVYPAKYTRAVPGFLIGVNSRYAVGKPGLTPDSVVGLALSNAHLLVGVYREEIPDVPGGVLGSLVRKGQLLANRELKLYLPNPKRENVFLSKREGEALKLVESMTFSRLEKINGIFGEDLTLEDVSWKLL